MAQQRSRDSKLGVFTSVVFLSVLGAFYFLHLPQFVQGGDTGELVAASYRLYVPHPPGYPLWIWLQYAWTHLFAIGTVFWRASFLSALFSWVTLFLIALPLRQRPLALIFCLLPLGLSTAFFEAAVLPDVFSFHALLVALIGTLYLFLKPESDLRSIGIPFLGCLGLAHHLTLVLMLPVFLAICIEHKLNTSKRRKLFISAALGLILVVFFYASLLLCNPMSPFSWGQVEGPLSLLKHFLRMDYGTFRLAPKAGGLALHGILFFLRSSFLEISGLIVFSAWVVLKNRQLIHDRRFQVWGITCLVSLGFLCVTNIEPVGPGAEVLRRFHVMSLVQLTLLCSFVIRRSSLKPQDWAGGALLLSPGILALAINSASFADLHHDSVFEDYATNLLKQTSGHKSALILAESDSLYFSLRYVQTVLQSYPGIAVASPGLFFHPWYLDKIQNVLPAFQMPGKERVWDTNSLDLKKDLILPNLSNLALVVTHGFQDGKDYKVTFQPLGRVLEQGSGLLFSKDPTPPLLLRYKYNARSVGPQAFSKGLLYAQYSHFFLARGLSAYSNGLKDLAKKDWISALDQVPFAYPALKNLCQLPPQTDPRCTPDRIEEVRLSSKGFF